MPRAVPMIAIIVALVMFGSASYELRQSRKELFHMLEEHSLSVAGTIERSSANIVLATDQLEQQLAERLLNNAYYIARLDSMGSISSAALTTFAAANNIYRINLFDRHGNRILGSHQPMHQAAGKIQNNSPREMLAPILSGGQQQLILGLKQARFENGQRYAVAIRRTASGGGAIVLNLDASDLLQFRRRIGIGKLIRDLGRTNDVEYVVLQDADGIVAATDSVEEMSSVAADAALQRAYERDTVLARQTRFREHETYEVIRRLKVEGIPLGILRIGMSMNEIRSNDDRMQRRFIVMSFVLLAMAALVLGSLAIEKKYRRIEAEMKSRERSAALGDLAAGVAHEIRNPLNAIGMIIQRFEREFVPRSGVREFRSLTDVMKRESVRVNNIIQQFLTFARPAPLHLASVDISSFTSHIALLFESQAKDKNVAFALVSAYQGPLHADREQLTQALLNLLQNALEATAAGGSITFTVSGNHQRVSFSIADTGRGIPAENLNRIFDLYFTTRTDGNGLGLAITQQIVSQHHGSIRVDSIPGKGSVFTITLPAQPSAA